ncbi:hypothetical protein LTR04_006393 [Oleoguttula sp. CCFEE 6159]|nr:hypothetical protein LTR04_006393 [Oleoguttula sp. CCFEE 6159]
MSETSEAKTNGVQELDCEDLRRVLFSSSTRRRTAELHVLREKLVNEDLPTSTVLDLARLLFDSHSLYVDRSSREAARSCLQTIAASSAAEEYLPAIIDPLKLEASKVSIAPGSAFVLTEWCSLLLQELAAKPKLWNRWGLDIIIADSHTLETCIGSGARRSVKQSALDVTRRGVQRLFQTDGVGHEALNAAITALTIKDSTPHARNTVLLGVIAGVCARSLQLKPILEERKKDYYAFYVREILGSRTVVPQHITDGLRDFLATFTTKEDLQKEIVPSVEKALLRAPEIVLNGLVAGTLQSLSQGIDLSEVLQKSLLKPLLANVKSTNVTIRNGALSTFETLASRSKNEDLTQMVADELLNPLKQSKTTSVDQRVIYAQMLSALNTSRALAHKIPLGLASLAIKEANEIAIAAETYAIAIHVTFALKHQITLDKTVTDAFVKGLVEKRLPARGLWALRVGNILWSLSAEEMELADVASFADPIVEKLIDIWHEVVQNPIPAIQNGQIAASYVATALAVSKLTNVKELKAASIVRKASVAKHALAIDPKPSFLLNSRVYTKVTSEEVLTWLLRALAAVAKELPDQNQAPATGEAWAQAFIYLITASGVPASVRTTATRTLTTLYTQDPARIAKALIGGLWQWRGSVEADDKDTAAVAAKTGIDKLYLVIRAICLSKEEASTYGAELDEATLQCQLVDLLVLCRPELLPRTSWIDTCLKTGTDPGNLAAKESARCLKQIVDITEAVSATHSPAVKQAACSAAAELAFVAPDTITPMLVLLLRQDLDPLQLAAIGPEEAAVFRTPEGTAFVDVLAKKVQNQVTSKNVKDYDTLKWEEELRAQLAQKKGQTKKLTADEQAKVNAQLAKESATRHKVANVEIKLKRGIGIVHSLAKGPPTEAETWIGPAVHLLIECIREGAGLILGDAAALAYLDCADRVSPRLGTLRPFVGVATLTATGKPHLPSELVQEPLGDLVTRVLYRLRFMGEQRPFDAVSFAYILPLIHIVLEKGGVGRAAGEGADEQIVLALEFLSFHTDTCTDQRLPRQQLLAVLITSMQKFNQHYKLIKDCLLDLCRSMAPSATEDEITTVVRGTIVPEVQVRTSVLQAINAELDLTDRTFYEEIWLACHDDAQENVDLAKEIWEENDLAAGPDSAPLILPYLEAPDKQVRRAAARALAESVARNRDVFHDILGRLQHTYKDKTKARVPERDEFGMPRKTDLADPWEARNGVALAFKELAVVFTSADLLPFIHFLVNDGPLGDRNAAVRDEMVEAATTIIAMQGQSRVEDLMKLFETTLEALDEGSETHDRVNEAVIILYGALARHLKAGDTRVPKVVQRLLATLSTPSETVQYAVAECLPPLVQASSQECSQYVQQMMEELLNSKKYAARRGAAYGLAGIVRGKGISALREFRILSTLRGAVEKKKDQNQRQGAFFAYELLSLILGRMFEPYVIQIVPQLLAGFGDTSADVREACLDAAKTCFASLSSFGVKQVLPTLLEGLDEQQWRSKKGACDSLGAMAYLDPQQLALSLPEIIPPLTEVLNDSHKEVRASANRSLQRFGEVISNPEIKGQVNVLLKALSDPTRYTDDALDALIKVSFVHYLDAPSLALVVRILERGLGDRSATKRKASQIIGSLAHLTERKDLIVHLPVLVAGLRVAIVDPVPTTRATASKALGSTIEKLGEDALPDLIPSLMSTLKSDTGAGDRLGSAQALSEVLAGLGTGRLEETLPTILQNVSSSKSSVREGFMSLFIFLPACFGNSFANYLSRIIPAILAGLADDVESIRETALRAGRLLVKNFATRAIDLLLPELERGLADDNHRIRLSSVELVGDLLFNLTGISGKTEQDEVEEGANEAGQSLLEVLGEERRNKVLSALYICRCDTSGLVRTAAINVWKALVATPRTLRELVPTLTQLLIRRLASSNMEQKVIAGNALGELIRKAGEGVLATLLPTLEEGLQTSTDTDARQGICIALRELIASASPEALEDYEKTLISVVRTALVDPDRNVREAAAEAFDSLQKMFGKRAVEQVLPHLLNLLRSDDEAENALSALLTLLTDSNRSNIILPNLLPTLLTSPITGFNARAIASLAEVASSAMNRRLPNILNTLLDNIVACKDSDLREELNTAFDTVLLSVDEYDGLNTAMSVMLALVKHDDHRKRYAADMHLAKFFTEAKIDISRYNPDMIRALLIAFDDSDSEVVKAAWSALNELTKRLRKEEMESLVISTRQVLSQVGVPGSNLPGFSLPKGISAVLPIFLQGLMNGTAEQRTQAALAISDIIDRTSPDALKPFVTQITGPLIRVVSERSVDVKAAILFTLNNLLEKIPTFLKPFLPQLQRTFAKSLADTSSEVLRTRAAKALGTLITLTPRIDPLIAELVTGSKTSDAGVRNAMLKALYEVVSKAGVNMNEISRNSILGLMDTDANDGDGKYLLTDSNGKSYETTKPVFEALAAVLQPGNPVDTRRLALVVIRTVSREDNDLVRPHLALLAPPVFAGVRDPVIPVKLSAEAAFLALFSVVEEESAVFDKFMAGPGASLQPGPKRSMQDYFKRVAARLGSQARERKEAEGGQGGLGLSSDEKEDEREVWSVGKVDLGDQGFGDN